MRALLSGVIVLLLAAPVWGQEVATSFGDLPRVIQIGDTVYVTNRAGSTIRGRLAGLSGSALELQVLRESAVPLTLLEGDVNNVAVDRFDSLWNGMLIGFAAGSIPVALLGLGCVCPAEEIATVSGGYGLVGLLTGLLIDTLNNERAIIYVQGQRSGIRVTPLLLKSAAGLQMSVGF